MPPPFKNLTATEIVKLGRIFDSGFHIWRALAWVDFAKRNSDVSALEYAALELRRGIEHLWFDMIQAVGGGKLDVADYKKCTREATKMYKLLETLSPNHSKLVRFTSIVRSIEPTFPKIAEWDIPRLKRAHGEISEYLHFTGYPQHSSGNAKWFLDGVTLIDREAEYIRQQMIAAGTGQLNVKSMPEEVRQTWEAFQSGKIDEESVRTRLQLAHPVLKARRL